MAWCVTLGGECQSQGCICSCTPDAREPRDPFTPVETVASSAEGAIDFATAEPTIGALVREIMQGLGGWGVSIPSGMLDDAITPGEYSGTFASIVDGIAGTADASASFSETTGIVTFSYDE